MGRQLHLAKRGCRPSAYNTLRKRMNCELGFEDIAERQGLPDSFAQPWSLPATAVSAEPPDASQGTPGMAPATGDSPVPAMNEPSGSAAVSGNAAKPKGLKPVTR